MHYNIIKCVFCSITIYGDIFPYNHGFTYHTWDNLQAEIIPIGSVPPEKLTV